MALHIIPLYLQKGLLTGLLLLILYPVPCYAQNKPNDVTHTYRQQLQKAQINPTGTDALAWINSLRPDPERDKKAAEYVKLLGNDKYQQREFATRALLSMPELPSALLRAASRGEDAEIRWRAKVILESHQQGQEELLTAALKVIEEDQPATAFETLWFARTLTDKRHILHQNEKALLACLRSPDVPDLTKHLKSPSPTDRLLCAKGLLKIGEGLDVLEPLLKDADTDVSLYICLEFANQGDRRCLPILVSMLESSEVKSRARAIQILHGLTAQDHQFTPYADLNQRKKSIKQWQEWLADKGSSAELHYPVKFHFSARGNLMGNLLVSTGSTGLVKELDPTGKVLWSYKLQSWSAEKLPNGNVITGSYSQNKMVEIDNQGKAVWEHDGISAMNVKPLHNGNFLVADFHGRRVLELSREKKVVWEVKTPDNCFDTERLPTGNTLAGCPNIVQELSPAGKVVHSWAIPGRLNGFQALPDGNIMVANYGRNRVSELDRSGNEIWFYEIQQPCDVFRADDGNILITTSTEIIEIDANKKVVKNHGKANYGSARK